MRNGLLLSFVLLLSTAGYAERVCKNATVPPNAVIVGEVNDKECGQIHALEKNAWDVAAPKDGIVVCQNPKTVDSYATVLQLSVCERVDSRDCPEHKGGGPNAYVMRSPLECATKKGDRGAELDKVERLRIVCNTTHAINSSGTFPMNGLTLNEEVVAEADGIEECDNLVKKLGKTRPTYKNALVVQDIEPDPTKAKAKARISCMWPIEHHTQAGDEWDEGDIPFVGYFLPVVIFRRFYDANCTKTDRENAAIMYRLDGVDQYDITNGVIRPLPVAQGTVLCIQTTRSGAFFKTYLKYGAEYFEEPVYDEKCGGTHGKPNAVRRNAVPSLSSPILLQPEIE
jgi:hypothetical protein